MRYCISIGAYYSRTYWYVREGLQTRPIGNASGSLRVREATAAGPAFMLARVWYVHARLSFLSDRLARKADFR